MPNEEEVTIPLMETVKVVEYLESSMSKDLLCKFPDNSAFDFDYTQSSIWSPLLPRASRGLDLSRKPSYSCESDFRGGLLENTKRMATTIKKKFAGAVLENAIPVCRGSTKRKRKSFGFSPVSGSSSPKAWANLMKAASKHFKKKKKKRDHDVHSNYLAR